MAEIGSVGKVATAGSDQCRKVGATPEESAEEERGRVTSGGLRRPRRGGCGGGEGADLRQRKPALGKLLEVARAAPSSFLSSRPTTASEAWRPL